MKTLFRNFVSKVAVAAMAATFLSALPCTATMIQLTPNATEVQIGDAIEIDIIASNINLGGYQLTLRFDPALVAAELFTFGSSMGDSFNSSVLGIDTVSADEISLFDSAGLIDLQGDPANNSFKLGTVRFRALSAGVAKFDFLSALLTDPEATEVDAEWGRADLTITAPPPNGTPTPEPSTALAGAVCLLMVVALGRYRKPVR